jgi:hypothetical protein
MSSNHSVPGRLAGEALRLGIAATQVLDLALRQLVVPNLGSLLRVATAAQRLSEGPPVDGYEPLLVSLGRAAFEARLVSHGIHFYGRQLKEERDAERALASAFTRLVRARGSTLKLSRRAVALRAQLTEQPTKQALERACWKAGTPELASELTIVIDNAAQRNPEACEVLGSSAAVLLQFLPNPRGRRLDVATAKHELLLECLHDLGSGRRFTRNPYADDFTDAATEATRTATGARNFDPRHACRLVEAARFEPF